MGTFCSKQEKLEPMNIDNVPGDGWHKSIFQHGSSTYSVPNESEGHRIYVKNNNKKTNLVSRLKKNKRESLLSTMANRWYKNPKSTTPHPEICHKTDIVVRNNKSGLNKVKNNHKTETVVRNNRSSHYNHKTKTVVGNNRSRQNQVKHDKNQKNNNKNNKTRILNVGNPYKLNLMKIQEIDEFARCLHHIIVLLDIVIRSPNNWTCQNSINNVNCTTNKKKTVHRKHPKVTHHANSALAHGSTSITLDNPASKQFFSTKRIVDTGRSRTITVRTPRRNTTNFPDTDSLTTTASTARCSRRVTPRSRLTPSSAPLTTHVINTTDAGSPECITTIVSTSNDPGTSSHMYSPSRTQPCSQQTGRIPTIQRWFVDSSLSNRRPLTLPTNCQINAGICSEFSLKTIPQSLLSTPQTSTQFVDLPKRSTPIIKFLLFSTKVQPVKSHSYKRRRLCHKTRMHTQQIRSYLDNLSKIHNSFQLEPKPSANSHPQSHEKTQYLSFLPPQFHNSNWNKSTFPLNG